MIMLKRFCFITLGALLGSTPSFSINAKNLSISIKSRNIGFRHSPASITPECLAADTFPGFSTKLWYNTAVEPSLAVNPKNKKYIVAAWQQDRFDNGGALETGIAWSEDCGKTWNRTIIPYQNCNGGITGRSSDPWLSYSADGSRVYLCSLNFNIATDSNTQNQEGVTVSYSKNNGKTWSNPHFIASSPNTRESSFPIIDKNSITTDPLIAKNAYATWDTFLNPDSFHSDTWFTRTTTGGKSWEKSRLIYNPFLDPGLKSNGIENDCQTINNIIVVLPNGNLLCFMTRIYAKPGATDEQFTTDSFPYKYTIFDSACIRSTDHGITWDSTATQIAVFDGIDFYTCGYEIKDGQIIKGIGERCRTACPLIFSVAVNPSNGNLYIAWEGSLFNTPGNQLPQIALATSRDGGFTWSAPAKVSRTPSNAPNPQAFTPSVAVSESGEVGVLYHDFRNSPASCTPQTKTTTWFALYEEVAPHKGSTGIGLNFKSEVNLSCHSYIMENGPLTGIGFMTNGDYESLIAFNHRFYALYTQSHKGPFSPAETVIDSPTEGTVIVDNNRRTSPFFSKLTVNK